MSPSNSSPEADHERRVLAVFEAALDRSGSALDEYLQEACADDDALRLRVRELLALHRKPSSVLGALSVTENLTGIGNEGTGNEGRHPIEALLNARPELIRALRDDPAPVDPKNLKPLASGEPRYRSATEIARGGMGIVYRIWDSLLQRPLALKVSRDRSEIVTEDSPEPGDSRTRTRLLEEARVTGQLDHPGVVPLHDIGVDGTGRVYFTMRLVDGLDLNSVFQLARDGIDGWSTTRVLGVLVRVCETLAYAHSKDVIHRDLKPANVMVGRYGETYVMDWGLAKLIGSRDSRDLRLATEDDITTKRSGSRVEEDPLMTVDGTVVGTPAFMPPEQAEAGGSLDARSDIYAVGALIYSLCAGAFPYESKQGSRSARAVLAAVRGGPPPNLERVAPKTAPEIVAICEKAMARSPDDRYRTMDALAEDLRAYLENRVVRAHRTGAVIELRKWVGRNRTTAMSLVALVVLLTVGLAVSIFLLDDARSERDAKEKALGRVESESRAKDEALAEEVLALAQKDEALTNADMTRLCAQSTTTLENDPGLALMMGLEAHRLQPGFLSRNALLAALDELREEKTLIGHAWIVTAAAFHPDGRHVATSSADYTVRVWDVASGSEHLRLIGHKGTIEGVTYDRAGKHLASWGWDRTIRVWDGDTGKSLRIIRHDWVVMHAAFNSNGRRLLAIGLKGTARLWTLGSTSDELSFVELCGHTQEIFRGGFSSDDEKVVTASLDGTARIWDAKSGRVLHILEGHNAAVISAEFSPDGELVLTASRDDTARIWDATSGESRIILRGHRGWLSLAQFSPTGEKVLTASNDATARVWDTGTGELIARLDGHEDAISGASFSPDGERVITASLDRDCRIWDSSTGAGLAVLRGHRGPITCVSFSVDGKRAITGSRDTTARIWNTETHRETVRLASPHWDRHAVFDPGGNRVIVIESGRVAEVRNARTAKLEVSLTGHDGSILVAEFNAQGNLIVTGSADRTARIWDASSGKELAVLRAHQGKVTEATFSPDGRLVATGSQDLAVHIWDVSSGMLLKTLRDHFWLVTALAFSPDGETLATASRDGKIHLWDYENGAQRYLQHSRSWLHAAVFSPDGRRLLTASLMNRMYIWDVPSAKLLAEVIGHDSDFLDGSFDASSDRLATLHADGAIHVWQIPEGERWASVRTFDTRFHDLGFESEGNVLWAEDSHGVRRHWSLDPIDEARRRRPRMPTSFDHERIDSGTAKDRARQKFEWFHAALTTVLAVGGRTLQDDPGHREALFQDARNVASFLRSVHRYADDAESLPSYAELARQGIEFIEIASSLPHAPADLEILLSAARNRLLPFLPTCASVDAALRKLDESTIADSRSEWRIFRARASPSQGKKWSEIKFDDSSWEIAKLPVGFGDYPEVKTELTDMPGSYSSVFLRCKLSEFDPALWDQLRLELRHDDGCIVLLNGEEIYRVAAHKTGTLPRFNARAQRRSRGQPERSVVAVPAGALRAGENILCLQVLNAGASDPDLFIDVIFRGYRIPEAARDDALEGLFLTTESLDRGSNPARYLTARKLQRRGEHVDALKILRELHAAKSERPDKTLVICRLVESLRASGHEEEASRLLIEEITRGAQYLDDDQGQLDRAIWRILRLSEQPLETYLRAAIWAERLRKSSGLFAPVSSSIPIAHYRLGLYRRAMLGLDAIRLIERLRPDELCSTRVVAFSAMARQKLGLKVEARKVFDEIFDPQLTVEYSGSPYVLEASRLLQVPLPED